MASVGKLFKIPPTLINEATEAGFPTPKSFVLRLPTVSIEDAAMEAAGSSPMKLGKELAIRCLAKVDDTLIAADGIHSELRPHVFPPSQPVFHGSVAYRGLVPHERLPDWPTDRWQMWLGKEELLAWKPQSDVAKPYPPAPAAADKGGPA